MGLQLQTGSLNLQWLTNKKKEKKGKERKQEQTQRLKEDLAPGINYHQPAHRQTTCLADCMEAGNWGRLGLLGWETAVVGCRRILHSPDFLLWHARTEALCAEERTLLADRLRTESFCSSSLLSIRSQALAREMCSLNKFSSVVKIGREILIALFSVCGEDETGLFMLMLAILAR